MVGLGKQSKAFDGGSGKGFEVLAGLLLDLVSLVCFIGQTGNVAVSADQSLSLTMEGAGELGDALTLLGDLGMNMIHTLAVVVGSGSASPLSFLHTLFVFANMDGV